MTTYNIKMADITGHTDDSEPYPRLTVSFNGKDKDVIRLGFYGICSVPPIGSLGLSINSSGQESTMFTIADDYLNRFKSLKPGEVKLGNYSKPDTFIYFKESGDLTWAAPKFYIGSKDINLLEKLVTALTAARDALEDAATVATYPTSVGPTGTMVNPSTIQAAIADIDGVIADIGSIDAGAI